MMFPNGNFIKPKSNLPATVYTTAVKTVLNYLAIRLHKYTNLQVRAGTKVTGLLLEEFGIKISRLLLYNCP